MTVEYITTFLATTVLARITLFAIDYCLDRDFKLAKLWQNDRSFYTSCIAGIVGLLPASIAVDGINTGKVYAVLVIDAVILPFFIWRISVVAKRALAEKTDESDHGSFFRYQLQRFMQSWAGGIVMGVSYGFLVTAARWKTETDFLTDIPDKSESRIYVYIFAGIIGLSIITFWFLTRRSMRRLPTAARLRRAVNYAWFTPAIIGLLIALIQNQTRNVTLANRYFTIAVFIWIVVAELWVIINVLPHTLENLRSERIHFEEQQRKAKQKKRKKSRR